MVRKACAPLVKRTSDAREFIGNATLFQGKDYEKQNSGVRKPEDRRELGSNPLFVFLFF